MIRVMAADSLAKIGQPAHRRILVGRSGQQFGCLNDHILGPAEIGKALPQIDGSMLPGEAGHMFEDRNGLVREKRVHSLSINACAARGLRTFAPEMKKI